MNFTVDISGIAALLLSIVALYKAFKQTSHDITITEASASKAFQEAANMAAERALSLEKRMKEMEEKILVLQLELIETKEINDCLKDWAERLVHQVISLGGDPVKMKQPRGKKDKE